MKKPRGPEDKTQAGDPLPESMERKGNELTADELAGRGMPPAMALPVQRGPHQSAKRCGWCGKALAPDAIRCDVCTAPHVVSMLPTNLHLAPWMRAERKP